MEIMLNFNKIRYGDLLCYTDHANQAIYYNLTKVKKC